MTRNELIEQVEDILEDAFVQEDNFTVTANAIFPTIFSALQEPTEGMLDVVPVPCRCGHDWRQDAKATFRAMLNASPLGEQSE